MRGSSRAVFFDLDGTLLDTTYLHTLAWWKALEEAGEGRPMAEIHRLIGMGSSELLTALLGHDDPDISSAHGDHYRDMHGLIRPLPGAAELVVRVGATGALVVMVTSAKKADLPALLGALGVPDRIDLVVDGEEVERAKPHPDLFAAALHRVELPPTSVVALGDAVWDVHAAGRAGIGCVGVLTGGLSESELLGAGALAVYDSCADLLANWASSPLAELLS